MCWFETPLSSELYIRSKQENGNTFHLGLYCKLDIFFFQKLTYETSESPEGYEVCV